MARIYHPDLDRTVKVDDRHVAIWEKSGWQLTEDEPPEGPTPPNRSASKADWVEFAVAQGLSRENAEGASKDDLIARFGG